MRPRRVAFPPASRRALPTGWRNWRWRCPSGLELTSASSPPGLRPGPSGRPCPPRRPRPCLGAWCSQAGTSARCPGGAWRTWRRPSNIFRGNRRENPFDSVTRFPARLWVGTCPERPPYTAPFRSTCSIAGARYVPPHIRVAFRQRFQPAPDRGRPPLSGGSPFLPHNHVWHLDLTTTPRSASGFPGYRSPCHRSGPSRGGSRSSSTSFLGASCVQPSSRGRQPRRASRRSFAEPPARPAPSSST